MYDMNTRSVSNILNLGRYYFKNRPLPAFKEDEGMATGLPKRLKHTALMAL
jgi:hypothetical protein